MASLEPPGRDRVRRPRVFKRIGFRAGVDSLTASLAQADRRALTVGDRIRD